MSSGVAHRYVQEIENLGKGQANGDFLGHFTQNLVLLWREHRVGWVFQREVCRLQSNTTTGETINETRAGEGEKVCSAIQFNSNRHSSGGVPPEPH